MYFLNKPLEEVKSLKLLGLTISHNHSWAHQISKMASKASHQLGILHYARSFLGQSEVLATCTPADCKENFKGLLGKVSVTLRQIAKDSQQQMTSL